MLKTTILSENSGNPTILLKKINGYDIVAIYKDNRYQLMIDNQENCFYYDKEYYNFSGAKINCPTKIKEWIQEKGNIIIRSLNNLLNKQYYFDKNNIDTIIPLIIDDKAVFMTLDKNSLIFTYKKITKKTKHNLMLSKYRKLYRLAQNLGW